jgi:perosamine synthetase
LALEALGVRQGDAVLIPTMTFAATAEIVRYLGAVPILVDCEPLTTNLSLGDAMNKLEGCVPQGEVEISSRNVVGVVPVHVGGLMMDMDMMLDFAQENQFWVVEDAAHAFPAAFRKSPDAPWRHCGGGTASVSCFSFYANKTITTGEGGMAVTESQEIAERIRLMSLHGLSNDAWSRYSAGGSWDYRIVAPGFKYNMTDVAGALGVSQLRYADDFRVARERVAEAYLQSFGGVDEFELPAKVENRIHSWHLFPIRLHLDRLQIDRNGFIDELRDRGVGCSVHWRPLHLHPYYAGFGWRPDHCPVATREWERLISLPLFPGMRSDELEYVIETVMELCRMHRC